MVDQEIKPLYCIYNDCDFPDERSTLAPCLIACNIPSYEEAEEILTTNILVRFCDYDTDGFYITEDYETVQWRLEDGGTLEEIFANNTCGIFY